MASVKPETIMESVLEFPIGQYGTFLATRSSARQAREDLEARIRIQGVPTTVLIRFDDVEAMTISFADEFLGRFYSAQAAGDAPTSGVILSGFNEETRETVAICLERRDALALAVDNDRSTLVGRVDSLAETFQAVLRLGEFRAIDLASALGITAQNANNRLKKLVDAGVVQRRQVSVSNRGGKEFVYRIVRAPAVPTERSSN
jgi:hypothetical protein